MQLTLNEGEWGYFFKPEEFYFAKLEETNDLADGTYLFFKERAYIEDIGQTVIQTTYGVIRQDSFEVMNKREFSKYLAQCLVEYLITNNSFPKKIKLKEELQPRKVAKFMYLAPYETFHLSIKQDMLPNKKDPYQFITVDLKEAFDKLLQSAEDKHKIEYAKSSRATCRKCGEKIMKGELRIGKPHYFQEHLTYHWYHENCYYLKQLLPEDFDGLDNLEEEDKKRILSKLARI